MSARALDHAVSPLAAERVAVLCGNSDGFVALRDEVTRSGRVFVPINPKLAPPEIAYIVRHSRAAEVHVQPALEPVARRARALLADPDGARWLVVAEPAAPLGPPPQGYGATLIYTSGTTGDPKGCLRTAAQEEARGRELVCTYSITADDVHLIASPLAHSAPGIFLRACRAVGAHTAILPSFSADGFLAAAAAHRATLFFLVPTQYQRLLALPAAARARYDLGAVRAALVAGAPCPPALKERMIEWLGEGVVWEFYGSSETGTVTVLPPDQQLARPWSVGRPPPGVELALRDGEVFVRSPTVMEGYLDGDTNALVRPHQDGFLSVGDLGRLDDDGYLYLVDRKHDTIISGGVNVHPAAVERALSAHPAIAGVVVYGIDDPDWGQRVCATVALKVGARLDPDDLRRFLRERVAPYEIPKSFFEVGEHELPLGASGKPLRRRARAQYLAARGS
jgi:acyl-CoA synthetase (AMP-forming)/AMP-acid ligase II